MKQPSTVYLDTSFLAYMFAVPTRNVVEDSKIVSAREWWQRPRSQFDVFTSQAALDAAMTGAEVRATDEEKRAIASLRKLPESEDSHRLSEALISDGVIPPSSHAAATDLSVAAIRGVQFLLTWNCDVFGALRYGRLQRVCRRSGFQMPHICTPPTLWGEMAEDDPIVAEVRRVREEILAEFDGDLRAYTEDVRRRTEEATKAGRKVVALPPSKPEGWQPPA